MIKRVKKWLGINGVRVEIELDENQLDSGILKGSLNLFSKTHETVEKINIRLIEKYSRGRGKGKLVDQYILGEESLNETIHLGEEDFESLQFELPFDPLKSQMDNLQSKNFVMKGLVKTAKMIRRVRSTYRFEAEIFVKNRAINPVVNSIVEFT